MINTILAMVEFAIALIPIVLWLVTIGGLIGGILMVIGSVITRSAKGILLGLAYILIALIIIQILRGV